ncbi:ATP-grasp fold amidoligase family protein [Kushneria konosiri]|nr:ATP-grasp fold amidoligase family protein [Kushneria konosiri]
MTIHHYSLGGFVISVKTIEGHERMRKLRSLIYQLLRKAPDAIYFHVIYLYLHRRFCNFRHPKSVSEKIFYRMRYPDPAFSVLADKVAVRDYVIERAGQQYLVPFIGVYDTVTQSQLKQIKEPFVIKANHSAGQVKVIKEPEQTDMAELAREANQWLSYDYAGLHREKHYRNIKPQLVIEKALLIDGEVPADYKVLVLNNGDEQELYIQLIAGRFTDIRCQFFTEDWQIAPFNRRGYKPLQGDDLKAPGCLDEMIQVAKALSEPFSFCRVDFFVVGERCYVGELTFTPVAGEFVLDPVSADFELGRKIDFPEHVDLTQPPRHRVRSSVSGEAGSASV